MFVRSGCRRGGGKGDVAGKWDYGRVTERAF